MWTIFKILNLLSVLVSAYMWPTANFPILWLVLLLDLAMIPCLSVLKLQFSFDGHTGRIILALLVLVSWGIFNESVGMGIGMLCSYFPVFYLIALPRAYMSDLLRFVTKWVAILLIPALIVYWITLFFPLRPVGMFVMEGYEPFKNYIFYIQTTYDYGLIFPRFNAFFPEPGHMSMVCVFLMMANRFEFKRLPWMWIILTAVLFSFSLAGYILTVTGFMLLRIDSLAKGVFFSVAMISVILGVMNYAGGDNAVNQMILDRLKYDQSKGIEGNNRFFNNTDFEFDKALKSGDYWAGVNGKTNMELIGGAGFKIYILWHGLIGALLVLALYASVIPPCPDWHYTLAFLFILILCFIQNAYPAWYAWLFPYVLGLNLNRKESATDSDSLYT